MNLFEYLRPLIGDTEAIEREKVRLDDLIAKTSSAIKSAISEQTASSLIWHLTSKDLTRMGPNLPVSDFPSHARYLRALAASIPFTSGEAGDDPRTKKLLEKCEELWPMLLVREMLDDLKRGQTDDTASERQRVACMMSLIAAIQLEITYTEQAERRISTLFGPFSVDIIEPQLGLGVDDIRKAFDFIKHEVPRRFAQSADEMKLLIDEWNWFRQLPQRQGIKYLKNLRTRDPRRERIARSFSDGAELRKHFLVFSPDDMKDILGNRTDAFFSAFSFIPGQVNQTYSTPFDDDVVRSRPFANVGSDSFFLFDFYYAPYAPLYRLIECFEAPRHMQRLLRRRDILLEEDAIRIFAPIVNAQIQLSQYFVPVGADGSLAERDLLQYRDGILLLIESKAKPLRSISEHRGNVKKIESDVKATIRAGYQQALSVWQHINAAKDDVIFYDSDKPDRRAIARLTRDAVKEVYVVVLLDSYYGLIGTDLDPWLDRDTHVGHPWVVDRDTLETIATKIDSFEHLTSFLRWRRQLHGKVTNEDEAVFAGYFVSHGPAPFPENADVVALDPSYTDVFEAEYYKQHGFSVKTSDSQVTPPVFVSMRREGDRIIREMDGKNLDETDPNATRRSGSKKSRSWKNKSLDGAEDHRERNGRNDPCPCGSGRKFKQCCMRRIM